MVSTRSRGLEGLVYTGKEGKLVRIRLKRFGSKNEPHWRIVVTDILSPRDGRFIEEIGHYKALGAKDMFDVKKDRLDYWVKNGAQMTETVKSLLKRAERKTRNAAKK